MFNHSHALALAPWENATAIDPYPVVGGLDSLVMIGLPGPLYALDPGVVPIIAGDQDTPVPSTVSVAAALGAGRIVGRILRRAEGKQAILYEVISASTAEEGVSQRRREHGAYR